ncbi:MAG: TfoX/Sxy family protein [Firmicutes bacterium]|nr:TfoX/Sxy family protein [Bacillota bacterium]
MASSKGYLEFVLERLSDMNDISYRAMMGEYIIYYKGKVIGGIYDDRFLVKVTKSAVRLMNEAVYEVPYDGAKEMLLVREIDDKGFLRELFDKMYDELPMPKKKKMNNSKNRAV